MPEDPGAPRFNRATQLQCVFRECMYAIPLVANAIIAKPLLQSKHLSDINTIDAFGSIGCWATMQSRQEVSPRLLSSIYGTQCE